MAAMRNASAIETARAFVNARSAQVIDLTKQLVAAPSPNLPGDETAPAAVVQAALASYGLPSATLLASEPHRPNLMLTIHGARPGRHLALCGHLDTKPVGEAAAEWRTDPMVATTDGDRLYGLGSTDMKGAVAAMIVAAAAFDAVKDEAVGSLTILLTADEENGSRAGAKFVTEIGALDGIDAIVLGEPSGLRDEWDAIRIVSRGACAFRVSITGTQTHSSISDSFPTVNANEAMARMLVALRREFKPRFPPHPLCPGGPTINFAVKVFGGVGYGVLPGHAEFWSDVRLTPGMNEADFKADLEAALAQAATELHGAKYELEYRSFNPASEVPPDHPAVIACQRAAEAVLGAAPPLGMFTGGTDAVFLQVRGGVPTVASFGPGQLPLAHGPNEWVSITSLVQAAEMYAIAALEFGASSPEEQS